MERKTEDYINALNILSINTGIPSDKLALAHRYLESDFVGSMTERHLSGVFPPRSCFSLSRTVVRGSNLFVFLLSGVSTTMMSQSDVMPDFFRMFCQACVTQANKDQEQDGIVS